MRQAFSHDHLIIKSAQPVAQPQENNNVQQRKRELPGYPGASFFGVLPYQVVEQVKQQAIDDKERSLYSKPPTRQHHYERTE